MFITTLLGQYDYEIIVTFFNQMINLIIGLMLFSYYLAKKRKKSIEIDIFMSFVIQSGIQLMSFLSPSINAFLNNFRTAGTIMIAQKYSGIRGLSVSGTNFFGLSVAYGLIFILYAFDYNSIKEKNFFLKILCMSLLIFGSFSSGRTALIGMFIGLAIILIKKRSVKKRKKQSLKNIVAYMMVGLLAITGICFLYSQIDQKEVSKKVKYLNNFIFEGVHNFINGEGFTTTSSFELFNEMYFKIDENVFVIGEGKYINEDGSYYRKTDAGYMRNILFFGIIGIIILLMYQSLFFYWKNNFCKNMIIFGYILLMHIKGECLGFLILTQNILFLMLLITMKEEIENGNSNHVDLQ